MQAWISLQAALRKVLRMLVRSIVYVLVVLWSVAGAETVNCPANGLVHVPDDDLRNVIQVELGLAPPRSQTVPPTDPDITCHDIQQLKVIHASAPRHFVNSLEGLQYAANLETLILDVIPLPSPGNYRPHGVTDFEAIQHLSKLKCIVIHGSDQVDLDVFSKLKELRHLVLIGFDLLGHLPPMQLENMEVEPCQT